MSSCLPKHVKLTPVMRAGQVVCSNCGRPMQPTGPTTWRHVAGKRRFSGKSQWLPQAMDVVDGFQSPSGFTGITPVRVRARLEGPER